ncbi:uncharacterized protein [Apostichopus japonicus]
MAVNPLFSGPVQSSRNHQHKVSSTNHFHNSNSLHIQKESGMESTIPRKKPRLNSDENAEAEDGEDPFEDFEESFTADDLDAIDMIASQALSQAPSNSANSFNKAPSSSTRQFSQKPLKQLNNVQVQQGLPTSDFRKKERPFPSHFQQARERPVQTNVNIPFHQLGKRSVKTEPSQGVTGGNNFLKKRATGSSGDRNVRNLLTPPKGTTMVDSSALPSGTQDEQTESHKLQQQLEFFKAETEHLNQKLQAMKSEKYRKDGEIEVLRQNLSKAQTDIGQLRVERIQQDEQKRREQVNKEKELQRELEALKTQLEFKEREIIETQTSFRNLQQRTCQDGKTSKSNCPSPRKSPRLIQVGSPSRQVFPTKALFMTGGAKQLNGQRSPVTKKGSPLKNQNRPSKSKSPVRSDSPRRSSSSLLIKKWSPPTLGSATQLKTRISNGCVGPSLMVGLLMKDEEESSMERSGDLIAMFNRSLGCTPMDSTGSGGSGSDIEQPLDAVQQDTSASRQRTACQAISSLLSSSSQDSQSLSVPLPRHPVAPDTPSLSEQHLAKIIPVIQEQLDCYLQELETLIERIRNRSRSESTSHHEVDERFLEERVVECRAKALVPGLQTLSKLCCYSRSICKMITAGCDEIHDAMDTCVEEIDPSAPITFTQTGSRGGRASSDQSRLAEWMKEPCRVVQLLQTILRLDPVKGHPCKPVRESGWRVISVLCRNTPDSKLKWCVPLLVQHGLSLALSSSSSKDTWMSALTTTTAVAGMLPICSQSDSCPLSHIYQWGTSLKSAEDSFGRDGVTLIRLEIVKLLLAIVSSRVNGASSLVETNCHCSYEVVGSVVFMLLEELKQAEMDKSSHQRWFLLEQGLLFLHIVLMQTRSLTEQKIETELELMHLVVRLHRLFKKADQMDKSQAFMLQDIWECVAGDDDVWEDDELDEDMQEGD